MLTGRIARVLIAEMVAVSLALPAAKAQAQYGSGTGAYPPTTRAAGAAAAPAAAGPARTPDPTATPAPAPGAPRTTLAPAPITPATAPPATAGGATTAAAADGKQPFKKEEIDALVAPIALYPDSLLSQVFMASTYPLEVVEADRWAKSHKGVKDDALTKELEKVSWDPSVKSLVNFPDVLAMMSDKLDWMVKLGDAFIGQQPEVMASVQQLRSKAQATGNLKSNEQQKVIVEAAPATAATAGTTTTQIIKIEPTQPEVIYVPTYNPTVVYGGWPYPSYPPAYYYPPGYVAGAAAISFGVGLAVGAAWGYAWGGCNWGRGDVDIDINRNVNINNNIDRSKYQNEFNRTNVNARDGKGSFKHDASHRQGVAYRDQATARQYNKGTGGLSSAQAQQSRDAYRGRAEAGRTDIARGGAADYRGSGAQQNNRSTGGGLQSYDRPGGTGNRAGSGGSGTAGGSRAGSAGGASGQYRGSGGSGSSGGGAFSGVDRGGGAARTSSQRGQASRSASPSGGGGGARGGGGRGGGGRR